MIEETNDEFTTNFNRMLERELFARAKKLEDEEKLTRVDVKTDYSELGVKLDFLVENYQDDTDDRLLKLKSIFNSVLSYLQKVDLVNIDIQNTSIFNLKLENQFKRECVNCFNGLAFLVELIESIEKDQGNMFNSVYFDTGLLDITDSFYEVRILKSKIENPANLDTFV